VFLHGLLWLSAHLLQDCHSLRATEGGCQPGTLHNFLHEFGSQPLILAGLETRFEVVLNFVESEFGVRVLGFDVRMVFDDRCYRFGLSSWSFLLATTQQEACLKSTESS